MCGSEWHFDLSYISRHRHLCDDELRLVRDVQCSHCIYGTNYATCVYIRITMVAEHAHVPHCGKVSPV